MGLFGKFVDFYNKNLDSTASPDEKVRKGAAELGYEMVCRGVLGMPQLGAILCKDGDYYLVPLTITENIPQKAVVTPIEIVGVSEVTKNATLVELDIRYRINGVINQIRVINHSVNDLLTIEDKLGYIG